VGTIAVLLVAVPALAEDIPLPRPRPPVTAAQLGFIPLADEAMKSASEIEEANACRMQLSMMGAVASSIDPLTGPGGCGAPDVVRLEAVMLKDRKRVPFNPAPQLRCKMAVEVAKWVRDDVPGIVMKDLGAALAGIENFDSYDCRGRNRVFGAKLSEHGRANALDLRSVKLADGRVIELSGRNTVRRFRESVRMSVCTRFTTVLGPGSDGFHEEHIHVDLAERRGGYRMCQWDVLDPPPEVPTPKPRPDFERIAAEQATTSGRARPKPGGNL
jgi:hypothetical protein